MARLNVFENIYLWLDTRIMLTVVHCDPPQQYEKPYGGVILLTTIIIFFFVS